jgi:hypothetical protein
VDPNGLWLLGPPRVVHPDVGVADIPALEGRSERARGKEMRGVWPGLSSPVVSSLRGVWSNGQGTRVAHAVLMFVMVVCPAPDRMVSGALA